MTIPNWQDTLSCSIDTTSTPTALIQKDIIFYGNAAFRKLCGNVIGKKAESLFNSEHADFFRWITQTGRHESDQTILTLAVGKSAGKEILMQIWPIDDNVSLLSIKLEYSLQRIADLDELTRLPNRRKANLLLEIEQTRLQRFSGFCLAVGDIDKFKNINDTYGHQVGDQVLQHVSKVLQSCLRESDWVARWGGEEFLIFIYGGELPTGMLPMNRIHRMLNNTMFEGPPKFPVTMSFGIVTSEQTTDIDTLIQKADTLMYDAKNNGRNCVMWESDDKKIWLGSDIKQKITDKKIIPLYKPICDWKNNIVAVNIDCGIQGENQTETTKIHHVADQLKLSDSIYAALIKKTASELPKPNKTPFFFPVNDASMGTNSKALLSLFKQFPYLHAGLSVNSPLSDKHLNTLIKAKIKLSIIDFSPTQAPLNWFSTNAVKHVIYPAVKTKVLPLLPPKIAYYAAGTSAAIAKKNKFAGLLSRQHKKLSSIKLSA